MKSVFKSGALAALFLFWASGTASADSLRTIAESNVNQWNAALEQRDLEQIMALYTDNAMLLEPNGQVDRTKDAIRSFWRSVLDSANVGYSFNVEAIQKSTSKIVLAAKWINRSQLRAAGSQTQGHGYYGKMTNVLVRQDDGSWKAQIQRWN